MAARLKEDADVGGGGNEGRSGLARALRCCRWCGKAMVKSVEVSEDIGG